MQDIEKIYDSDLLEKKIYSLSGYEINKRLTLFVNAILVFQGNSSEIIKWYRKINDPQVALNLWNPDNNSLLNMTNLEMQRLFSNFLMSSFAVRDHWYAIKKEYYSNTIVFDEIDDLTKSYFGDNELAQFMQDFRNYVTHKGYPSVSKELSFANGVLSNDIWFDKSELLKFNSWKSGAKQYIDKIGNRVKLIDLVSDYSELINSYYEDVLKELLYFHKDEMDELSAYKEKYGLRLDIVSVNQAKLGRSAGE